MSLGIREELELKLGEDIDPWHLCDDGTLLSIVLKAFDDTLVLSQQSIMSTKSIELVKEIDHVVSSSGVAVNVKYLYKDKNDLPPPLSFLVTVKDSKVSVQVIASRDLGDSARSSIEDNKLKIQVTVRDLCSKVYSFFRTYDIGTCLRSLDCFVKLVFISEPLEEKDVTSRELSNAISSMYRNPLVGNSPRVISATSNSGDVVRAYVIPKKSYYFYAVLSGKETESLEELSKFEKTFRLKVYTVSKVSKILSRESV